MNLSSTRGRLFRLQVGAATVVVLWLAASAYLLLRTQLRLHLEGQLEQTAQAIVFSVEHENGRLEFEESAYLASREGRIELGEHAVAQWLDLKGRLVHSRGDLPLAGAPARDGQLEYQLHPVPACVYTLRAYQRGVPFGYARVARSLEPMNAELSRILWILLASGCGLVLLSALGSWWWTGRLLGPLQQAYAELAAFSSSVAHELRTPITAMYANCQSLSRRWQELPPEQVGEALAELTQVSEDMARIVNDMLLLAQLSRDTPAQPGPVALGEVLSEIVARLKPLARARGVSLRCSGEDLWVLGIEGHVRNLLRNLIENALYYTDSGGLVEIGCGLDGEVWVQDSGVGLSPEQLAHIFEPFWRGDAARSRHWGGAGLGLAIVQRAARACGAEVKVSSRPGQGSRFSCVFQVAETP